MGLRRANSTASTGSKTFCMARIYPFRAWRYNPSAVRLEDVVTQPYDKISPAMQQAYYQRSPFNLVRIILGLPELFDAERGENVYTRAARDFRAWREQGVLVQEKDPCIFAYSQRFKVPGTEIVKERRGFIALGKLHDYAEQVVFRHEQTLSKPKSDRLNLLKATRAHFGQIFMLYSDPAGSVEKILYDGNGPADAEVTDEYGVLHRLWRVSDPAAIRLLTAAMADKKLIIADGHHRYETALNYSKEHAAARRPRLSRSASQLPQPAYPEAAVMMTFVNMDSDGLVILPTHRVVHSLPQLRPGRLCARRRGVLHGRSAADGGRRRVIIETARQPAGHGLCRRHPRRGFAAALQTGGRGRRAGRPARAPAPARPEPTALHRARPAARPGRRKGPRADQHPLPARCRRGRGPGSPRRGRRRLPHQPRLHGATAGSGLCRRRDAAEVHRLLPQAAQRFDHLCAGLTVQSAVLRAQPGNCPPLQAPPAPATRFVVVLDAAHGGDDAGGRLSNGQPEKAFTLALSVRLRSLLAARGIQVVTTRESDVAVDPEPPG